MVSDLIGAQAHTWDKLSSISRSKKIGSAYLFSGPVGSGRGVDDIPLLPPV